MTMQAESLEVLEKADVPPSQARAIVRAIEIEIAGAKDVLATRHDIVLLRADLRQEVSTLRSEMAELSARLRGEMADLSASLRGEMTDLRTTLRGEMAEMRGGLRAEIHAMGSSISRQMYTAMLGQMAVLLGIAYFFVTHVVS